MAEAFPLAWPEGWPRTPSNRRTKSRFGSNVGVSQVGLLKNELRLLGAKHVIVSSNVPVRNDGMPYATESRRRYDDPGVAVYFELKGKRLSMARDTYYTPWENVRSLVTAIEHMRGLERHGGSIMVERAFSGFVAIPPPAAAPVKRPWWEVLEVEKYASPDSINVAYRRKAKGLHPDQSGSTEQMTELNVARDEALASQ